MFARIDASDLELELKGIGDRARTLNRVMPLAAEILVSAVGDVYDAEGPGWEPLAPSTIKRRRGGSAHILVDTGVMAGSTHPQHGSDWAEAFAGADYAIYHSPDAQGRDPFNLGPFEAPALDEVADLVAEELVK